MNDRPGLTRAYLHADPFEQFSSWFASAQAAEHTPADTMTLATSTTDGKPSARMVLLRGFDASGFVFYTNYESRKANELLQNPHAALVFYWHNAGRQVRIEGTISVVDPVISDAYFAVRPTGSRIGAWTSPQSRPIENRAILEAAYAETAERFRGKAIPRPPNWGGFNLSPVRIEFWQSRENRLHDRFAYQRRAAGEWAIERLAP